MSYVSSPDPAFALRPTRSYFAGLVSAQMFSPVDLCIACAGLGREQVKMRGFSSPISVRNLANDVPDGVVDTLLGVIRQNAAVFQRFSGQGTGNRCR